MAEPAAKCATFNALIYARRPLASAADRHPQRLPPAMGETRRLGHAAALAKQIEPMVKAVRRAAAED
jgi:hypothetical protein